MKHLHDIPAPNRYFTYIQWGDVMLTDNFWPERPRAYGRGLRFPYPEPNVFAPDPLAVREPNIRIGHTRDVIGRLQTRADRLRWAGLDDGVALTVTAVEHHALLQDYEFVRFIEGQRIDRMTFMGFPLAVVPDA